MRSHQNEQGRRRPRGSFIRSSQPAPRAAFSLKTLHKRSPLGFRHGTLAPTSISTPASATRPTSQHGALENKKRARQCSGRARPPFSIRRAFRTTPRRWRASSTDHESGKNTPPTRASRCFPGSTPHRTPPQPIVVERERNAKYRRARNFANQTLQPSLPSGDGRKGQRRARRAAQECRLTVMPVVGLFLFFPFVFFCPLSHRQLMDDRYAQRLAKIRATAIAGTEANDGW